MFIIQQIKLYKNKYAEHFVGMLHCSLCFYGHHLSYFVNSFDVVQWFGHTRKVKGLTMDTRFSVLPQNVSSCKIHMAYRGRKQLAWTPCPSAHPLYDVGKERNGARSSQVALCFLTLCSELKQPDLKREENVNLYLAGFMNNLVCF